ncbi:MAG: ATP-dependent RNA helicase HrpA [Xanthomonadaceae bacterium]|jgi:ATP-dependent helicase HrpA|nr:ATP-dependent RNA helicase HrpA [Xanthomonadaceae bacterium]
MNSTAATARSRLRKARNDIDQAMSRDRGRLHGLWLRWQAEPDNPEREQALQQALAASVEKRVRRAGTAPAMTLDESLPIAREAETIVDLIRRCQVVVIAGETGSGKTTQLPKLCLAAGRGAAGMIGCTQPRRIAARAVARRVAEELHTPLGEKVGYQVRFTEQVGDDTRIKFMTDGILLAEIASDRWLSAYDTIIVDEAHERSLNIDFLLGYLKQLLRKRRDLKVIVTSATIDTARFACHFGNAPVVSVEGRAYPVEVRYRPLEGEGERDGERSVSEALAAAVDEITRADPRGDVLVFLPGEREIRDAHQMLEKRRYRETEVLPLYARLSARDQDRVFDPGPKRRLVLATNVAETSLTVPRIRYVIDPGYARVKRYSPRQKLDRLYIETISRASADQRKGRCGRVADGICYRLYSEADFLSRPEFTDPEIKRSSLAGVILRMLHLGLGHIEDFPFVETPDERAIADGWQQLAELGAVTSDERGQRKLSAIGRQMARLPVDVKLARMLVAAQARGCLREMTILTAFMGIQDPRERPAEARPAADNAHAGFADPRSEFLGILKLWQAYDQAHVELTRSRLRDWCGRHFLGFLRMREWRELHRQLRLLCQELGWQFNAAEAAYPILHRALLAGLPAQVGHKTERGDYQAPRQRRYQLFPGSPLARKPPPWVLSATLLDTQRVWGLTNAAIEPDWVIAELPHLLARKHFDPRWSRAQGHVLASEQISLFGLVLAPKKPVHYGRIAPLEAHDIFVRQALVTGEIGLRARFVADNLKTLDQAREEEAKLRRAGIVADEDWQARWYLDRIPSEIHSSAGLEAWYKKLSPEARRGLLWSVTDLLPGEGSEEDLFPKYFALGDARLRLHYRFEPGAEDDGVSLDLPLPLLHALDPARLSWLMPGFVAEKAAELIRGLPKALRRNCVPAPEFGRAFFEAWPQPGADSIQGELARFLSRATGATLTPLDFDEASLAPHLRMNLRLHDDKGRYLASSRDLDELRACFGERAGRAFAARAGRDLVIEGLRIFPGEPIPLQVPGEAGVPTYPALVDEGEHVALRIFAERAKAEAEHPRGVRRLLEIALADKIKQVRKQLPIAPKTGLLYAAIESQERLRGDLVDAALNTLLGVDIAGIRDIAAFQQYRDDVGKRLFAEAMERLKLAETILAAVAEVKPRLEPPLMGWASGNLDDLRAQLRSLLHPGFLRETPTEALAQFPRYLKAMTIRAERAMRDPARDQERMLELRPFVEALTEVEVNGERDRPEWQGLRWDLEELRVSLFAQELGVKSGISAKKLTQRLQALARTK